MIEILASNGESIFDTNFKSFKKVVEGSFVINTTDTGNYNGFQIGNRYWNVKAFTPEIPDAFFFLRAPQGVEFVVSAARGDEDVYNQDGSITRRVAFYVMAPLGTQIDYQIYSANAPASAASGYGFQVFDAAGALKFSSSTKSFSITDFFQILGVNQFKAANTIDTVSGPSLQSSDGGLPFVFVNSLTDHSDYQGKFQNVGVTILNNSQVQYRITADYNGLGFGDYAYKRPVVAFRIQG